MPNAGLTRSDSTSLAIRFLSTAWLSACLNLGSSNGGSLTLKPTYEMLKSGGATISSLFSSWLGSRTLSRSNKPTPVMSISSFSYIAMDCPPARFMAMESRCAGSR